MSAVQGLAVDEAKIKKAVQSGIPLIITTYTLPHDVEMYIEQVLTLFLKFTDQEKLRDYVVYCVQELAVNAKKANTKRVYFAERGLDIANPQQYKTGMATFKEDTLNNIAHYLQLQKAKGLYIKLYLRNAKNTIHIQIHNNVVASKLELIRIHDKLARSRQYNDLQDALSQVLDDSEGAGLGLVILVLMLKKVGLDEDCFNITASAQETIASLTIPLDQTRVENLSILSDAIVNNVNTLPQFPENIIVVQKLAADPKSEMADIARCISMDPSLTADLLKMVNSAQYMMSKKVDSISEAVKIVGIKGIKNLLYSYGTQKLLGDDTADKKALWEHSYRTAFYAHHLARNFQGANQDLLDDVYVGGMLHDMGKIIFSNVHPDLLRKIEAFCTEKRIPTVIFEDISAGMNHAEIGSLVAARWNFPDGLVCTIRYHHDPLAAPPEFASLVEIVYLANMFCEYEEGAVSFEQFEPSILKKFSITTQQQLEALIERFATGFKEESQRS